MLTKRNFSLLLTETEAALLEQMARQSGRSRGAELRQLLRREMQAGQRQSGPVPNFAEFTENLT